MSTHAAREPGVCGGGERRTRARHPVLKHPHLSRARRLTGHLLLLYYSLPRQPDGILCAGQLPPPPGVAHRPLPVGARAGDGEGNRAPWARRWRGALVGGSLDQTRRAVAPHGIGRGGCVCGKTAESWSLLECAIRRRQPRAAQLNSSGTERVLRAIWKHFFCLVA
uniref:Uncharacterized protein n=1 Tax=Setaria viridis TaxID=4556 RepID=A0A4U6W0M6_SETVI|nr:hypothetical protein SEVIR_2G406500v2 [Setaria viridis]